VSTSRPDETTQSSPASRAVAARNRAGGHRPEIQRCSSGCSPRRRRVDHRALAGRARFVSCPRARVRRNRQVRSGS
jgi:hypothetical protein